MPSEEDKNIFLESLQKETESVHGDSGEEEPQKPPKKRKPLSGTALFATLFLLFLLVITLLIFVISVGGAKNPILQSFNIESGDVKSFLKGLVNWTFGGLMILLLLLFSLGLFRGLSAKKEEKQKRRNSLIFGGVSGGLIFPVVLAWLGLFTYINGLPAVTGVDQQIEITNVPTDQPVIAPLTLSFSAENIENELRSKGKRIRKFLWDKESDGNFEVDSGHSPTVDLFFREKGRQRVTLMVEIEGENPQVFDIEFNIADVVFQATPPRGEVPLTVEFDADEVTSGMAVKTFEWDFDGDGEYEETTPSSKITYTFHDIGIFSVHLRVIQQDDQVVNFTRDITVTGSTSDRLKAVIQATPQEGTIPLEVRFSGKNSFTTEGKITGYLWNFDEDVTLRGDTVTYTFPDPGSYRVELEVENSIGLTATATVEVTAQNPVSAPVVVVRTDPRPDAADQIVSEETPLTVSFDASQTTDPDDDIVSFAWDFNQDGQADEYGEQVTHTFETADTFVVKLTVTDAEDNVETAEFTVVTQKNPIKAFILADPETGSVPLTVDFDGSESNCGEDCRILSYEWNFGDGTPPQLTGAHTKHTFTVVGTYTVVLTVTTDGGATAKSQKIVAVRIPPLKACFTPSRFSGKAPLTVSFKDCSHGTIESWKWDFGDGIISEDRTPEHTFEQAGEYTVILQVTDANNTTSETEEVIRVE